MEPPSKPLPAVRRAIRVAITLAAILAACEPLPPEPDPDGGPTVLDVEEFWHIHLLTYDEDLTPQPMHGGSASPAVIVDLGEAAVAELPNAQDDRATAEVYSNPNGTPYWVSAESPAGPFAPDQLIGSKTQLSQWWRFRKDDPDASLSFVITAVELQLTDANLSFPDDVCSWGGFEPEPVIFEKCKDIITARVQANYTASVEDTTVHDPDVRRMIPFFATGGTASLVGFERHVNPFAGLGPGWNSSPDLFRLEDFELTMPSTADQRWIFRLTHPIRVEVPIDTIAIGTEFDFNVEVEAVAWSRRINESYAAAFFRDPINVGASAVEFEGLTLLPPSADPRERKTVLQPAPACTVGGGGGTIEFERSNYSQPEWPGDIAVIGITRTGGTGEASVLFTTESGTATAGADYGSVSTHVWFGAGESGTRYVSVPIVADSLTEGDETVRLILSGPSGCGNVGSSEAELTIVDDDVAALPNPTYTIGGTVTGLEGSGLVLTNLSTDDLPITANGGFTFAREYPNGHVYHIAVDRQPTNPDQECTVENDRGTIQGADVTDVLVTCQTIESPGGLDGSFGESGKVTLDVGRTGSRGEATDLALQADGRIVVTGGNRLARYNTDGTLDATFANGGAATVDFYGRSNDQMQGVAIDESGRILVAGTSRDGVTSPVQEDFVAARYRADGSLDTTFGTDGEVVIDFQEHGDAAYDVLVQADGSIVLTGSAATDLLGFGVYQSDFAAIRLSGDGEVDGGFGGQGYASANVGGDLDLGYGAALQPDGKILIAGRVAPSGGSDPDFGLVRFEADGSLDTSFGDDGILRVRSDEWDEAADVTVQPDGRILVVGFQVVGGQKTLVMERYLPDGTPDASFGSGGRVTDDALSAGRAVVAQADGSILVGGELWDASVDFAVARFSPDGTLDETFGEEGVVQVDFFGETDYLNAIAVQPDGAILAVGSVENGASTLLGLVRILQ
ncbi:MAG TPA: Calx-beta domain-containing protein [Longimicrobiaceae bacterium]